MIVERLNGRVLRPVEMFVHMVDEVEGKRGCDDIFLIRMFHCTAPIEVNSITCT